MTTWAIAHRGASDKAPENTLVAFQQALEQGADGLECDVHLSADGEIVVIHDDTVDRTTNGSGEVAEMTWEELRQLDAGSWKHTRYAGQQIPALREVIELLEEETQLLIELRSESPELAKRLVDLIHDSGVAERTWLLTDHRPTLEELRHLTSEIKVRWREGMESGDFVLTWPERLTESTVAIYREWGMCIFTTIRDDVPNSRARADVDRMLALEIDGIICNRVGLLRELLDQE